MMPRIERSFERSERRLASVGWAVKTSSTQMRSSSDCTSAAENPCSWSEVIGLGDRLAVRLGMGLGLASAEHAEPLPVFRQVGQLEKRAETADDVPQVFERERFDQLMQLRAAPRRRRW